MLRWQKDHGVPAAKYYSMAEEDRVGKFIVGPLTHNNYPEFTQKYQAIIDACRKKEEA